MEKKPKILFVITKSSWGGAQRYVYDLATHFKTTYDVAVVLGGNGLLKTTLEKAGVRVIPLTSMQRDIDPKQDVYSFWKLFSIFKQEHPDIVHLNSSKAGGLGAFAARFCGVRKIIFTAHGWAFNENRSPLHRKITLFLHWCTVLLSHRTIAVSQKTYSDMVYMPLMRKKLTMIHNGIAETQLIGKLEARKHLSQFKKDVSHLDPHTLWIGTISELHPNKGLDVAIEAIIKLKQNPTLPSFCFFIIGDGQDRQKLENKIKESHLEKSIFLLGAVPEASKYLNAFDIFTLTSITEGLPFVILEAGMATLPVVASRVGGIPEIITQLESGILVKSKNVMEIAESLQFLLLNDKKRTQLGIALHQIIKNKFAIETMYRKTETWYR